MPKLIEITTRRIYGDKPFTIQFAATDEPLVHAFVLDAFRHITSAYGVDGYPILHRCEIEIPEPEPSCKN